MKKAFTTWYNYLIGVAGFIVIACIAIIPRLVNIYGITDHVFWPAEWVSYVFLFCGILVFFIGFVIQDIYRAKIRHKTKNWNDKLPDKNLNTAWGIFAPLLLVAVFSVLAGAILSIPALRF